MDRPEPMVPAKGGKADRLGVKLRRSAEALAKAEGRHAKRVKRAGVPFDKLRAT